MKYNYFRLMRFKLFLLISFCILNIWAQPAGTKKDDASIAKMVATYKQDLKGPYRDIRWFCPDGSFVAPQERCPEPGVQRARYKDDVIKLGASNHIYFGQILSATPFDAFWDKDNEHSRLKQYQLEQFLRANDNGWINRKAQYYRGAYQIEDEELWGIRFFQWVLQDTLNATDQFFLIRQSAKDIPHAAGNNIALNVRALSKEIADEYESFMNLRVKIHGQPEASDIAKVKSFRTKNASRLTPELNEKFAKLISEMETLYKPTNIQEFRTYLKNFPKNSQTAVTLKSFIDQYNAKSKAERIEAIAEIGLELRSAIGTKMSPNARLTIIDISNRLETLLLAESAAWKPETLREQLNKTYFLTKAAAAFGYLELWEWERLNDLLAPPVQDEMTLNDLNNYVENSRRSVEWGTAMVRATYEDVVKLYGRFEPLAHGLVDDKVRASVLLQMGANVSILGDFFSKEAGFSNSLMGIPNQSSARGLNPGYALGELVVTTESPEDIEVVSDKIYVFNRPPADLKPIAGIATVTEGNLVSHVQLLARNLGIPNAVISMENLTNLLPFAGKQVFYAVSNRGTVLMKSAEDMIDTEKALFTKKARSEDKISVPVERMELSNAQVLNLRNVNASASGKISGPKAANLGQLKQLYPDNVVEGLVIPFAIFKKHFDQVMPDQNQSYWSFLNGVFEQAQKMRAEEQADKDVETYVLAQLDILQRAIKVMPLFPEFEAELKQKFIDVLGGQLGTIPVFIRSDTNMEDLKDFTGAGLNLTLFNVLDSAKILQGIKDVWASPYTERSYKWRQKYLLNPENVFPSILIIPTVNADASGVMITKGITNGNNDDVTVAFNRGVGGAVEGQASESWLLKSSGENLLLSPARQPEYTTVPTTGGTGRMTTTYNEQILTESRLANLNALALTLKEKLPEVMNGPYDVELGFQGDSIWLFQVRPFVENKRAAASEFLRSITPELDGAKLVLLNEKLN
jgi:hypothetical protein